MSAGLWRNSCPQQLCRMYLESALNFNVYLVTILECSSYKCDAVQISTTLSVRQVKRRVVRIFMGSHCRGYIDAQMVWCWVLNCKMMYQSKKKKSCAATRFYEVLICSWEIFLFDMGLCDFTVLFLQHTMYYAGHVLQWENTQADSKWIRSGLGSSLAVAAQSLVKAN